MQTNANLGEDSKSIIVSNIYLEDQYRYRIYWKTTDASDDQWQFYDTYTDKIYYPNETYTYDEYNSGSSSNLYFSGVSYTIKSYGKEGTTPIPVKAWERFHIKTCAVSIDGLCGPSSDIITVFSPFDGSVSSVSSTWVNLTDENGNDDNIQYNDDKYANLQLTALPPENTVKYSVNWSFISNNHNIPDDIDWADERNHSYTGSEPIALISNSNIEILLSNDFRPKDYESNEINKFQLMYRYVSFSPVSLIRDVVIRYEFNFFNRHGELKIIYADVSVPNLDIYDE